MNSSIIFEPSASRFINSLTPVSILALMGDIKDKLHYQETRIYLEDNGYNPENFYFNRGSYLSWFCYYHEFVLVDITHLTREALEYAQTMQFIRLEKQRLNKAIQDQNYKAFFYMVDKRIALYAYQRLYNNIPDSQKYELFWLIYSRCDYHLKDFSRNAVQEILKHKQEELNIPDVEKDGYVKIYRGQIAGSTPVSQATSWTTDINTAIYYATRHNQVGDIFSALINKDNIVAYIKRLNNKEIAAFPEHIQDIKKEKFITFDDLLPELEEAGVLEAFRYYSQKLKPDYFHNPNGIHGLSHTRRVLLLVLILAHLEYLSPLCSELLSIIALYHDIGRTNDNFDPHHGRESFKKANRLVLLEDFNNESDREIINFIITNHCVEDNKALASIDKYQIKDKPKAIRLFKIFKDADGLDRIRINDLDTDQLRTESARRLPLLARQILNSYL